MNLLENKDILRNLLFQGDQMNTLAGGVSKIDLKKEDQEDGFLITVHAPGVAADQLKVITDQNSLQIFATLDQPSDSTGVMIPIFFKKVELPNFVDTSETEAVHEQHRLEVFVPMGTNATQSKTEVEIRQL